MIWMRFGRFVVRRSHLLVFASRETVFEPRSQNFLKCIETLTWTDVGGLWGGLETVTRHLGHELTSGMRPWNCPAFSPFHVLVKLA